MSHKQDKSLMLSQGVFIFVYLAVLTLIEFGIAITFNSAILLIVIALVKAVLVVYYYMHIYQLNAEDHDGDENSYTYKTGTNRIGLWLFLISDSFVFGGLLVMRINLLGMTHPHLNQNLGLFVTGVLLVSSFFMNRGETMMKNGDRQGFLNNTVITFVLGLLFFLGVVAIEWRGVPSVAEFVLALFGEHDDVVPLTASSGPDGAAFFMMTGMHAFHVLTGLILLAIVWVNGRKGLYDEKHYPVEAAAVYWHFVDVVWIFFYPALYLVGTVFH
jgi:cytochrome c oxidase subunit III